MTSPQLPTPGTWVIEPSHSTVEAVARHLRITKVRGRFDSYEGKVVVADDPLASEITVTIDAASIATANDDRDAHLRSEDFLHVAEHPTLEFRSTGITEGAEGYEVAGELSMRGVTRPVTLDVEYGGLTEDPWGNTRALFAASTTIDRTEWGLTWNQALEAGGVLVSKELVIEIEAQLVQA